MAEENIYKTPEADLRVQSQSDAGALFFTTSQPKLLILFITTLGAYTIYWFYKHWTTQQQHMEKKIIPALRSIFYIFFTHSLFNRVEEAAIQKDIKKSWHAGVLATFFVVFTIISNVLDRVSRNSDTIGAVDYASILIVFVLVYPLYLVQDTANKINNDPKGMQNSVFSIYNYIFIILGLALWALILIGLFGLSAGLVS